MTREANALLDANDPGAMRAWLEIDYRIAQAEDDRVAITRLLADPDSGRCVIAEVNALLDANDSDAMRAWLETGYLTWSQTWNTYDGLGRVTSRCQIRFSHPRVTATSSTLRVNLPQVRDPVHALYAVREDIASHHPTLSDTSVGSLTARMRALFSTSFSGGTAHPVFAVATAPSVSVFNEAMYTPTSGLTAAAGTDPVTTATPRDNAFSARLAAIAYARWLANGGTEGAEDSP